MRWRESDGVVFQKIGNKFLSDGKSGVPRRMVDGEWWLKSLEKLAESGVKWWRESDPTLRLEKCSWSRTAKYLICSRCFLAISYL
jgi:hypothetical protein